MDDIKRNLEMPGLEFDEATHTYRLDGNVLPSVTTIMKPLSAFEYRNVPESALEKAADRGTTVHNAIEIFIKYGIDDIPTEFRPYLDAFIDWWNEKKPVVIGSEIRLYHRMFRYCGTCDLLCLIDGKLILIDYKTTYAVMEKMCGVQLEGYAKALSSHGINVDEKRILHLKKDGKYKEHIFPAKDTRCGIVFDALRVIYEFIFS